MSEDSTPNPEDQNSPNQQPDTQQSAEAPLEPQLSPETATPQGSTVDPQTPPQPVTAQPSPTAQPTTGTGRKLGVAWLLAILAVALLILGGAGWFIMQSFNSRVNTDHAEHMEMSPSVHEIVHVRQKLLVGTEDTFEPMEFRDATSQERVGFDIDLARAIAQELNVPVEFQDIDFESIFGEGNLGKANVLTRGDVDMLIDSVTITDARKKYFLFSDPYINVGQVAVTLGSNNSIQRKSDLTGKRLTVAESTSNEKLAESLTADGNVIRLTDPVDQAQAVINGEADAMIVDLTNAKGIVNHHPELKIATDPFTKEYYGIVMAKGKDDLATTVNQILSTLKQRGVIESLQQKWFE
jgi:polar amino acid transport system substrate-binding protein